MVETGEKGSSPSSSSSYAFKDMDFFKVFLPEFSSRQLVIPQAFIDILNKPLPNQVLLVDEIGRLWGVETKTEHTEERVRVCLNKGWEKFADDQSLEFGDFLLFSYDCDSRFSVTIFGKNGCKKDLVVADKSRVDVEKEPVIFKPVEPERRKGFGERVIPNRKRVLVKEEPSVLVEVEPEHRRKVNRAIDPGEMACVPEKKHKGFEEPVYKPKNPHFVRNITNGSRRQMDIPTIFLKSNGIEMEEDIELCDENGKKWPMKIVIHNRGRRLAPGPWVCFCKSHKLRTPDKCLFEFIVRSNGTCNQILVRIGRGSMFTTVTKDSYQVLAI